jgi:small conductance mechanosensitive channel
MLLAAPGDGVEAVGSLALSRAFFLVFQGVLLILITLIGRRHSLLMSAMLSNSRERDGVLWRIWPVVHLLFLAAIVGLIGLNVMGYQYAARFIWQRAFASLSVVLILRLLLVMIILRFIHWLVLYLFSIGGRLQHRYADIEATAERYFGVLRTICHVLLAFLSIGLILELWGISVRWFLASPLTWQVLSRVTLIVVIVGLTVAVLQISSAFTDYLIRPKSTGRGVIREPSRKLKTLVPLIQTLIKVGAVFTVILVVLEQVNIATGPILTGVGILGLAVGFASQSLIKDVINGLFLLFEDSLSVGDVVNLRGIGGVVEKVTLRAVTIRDLSGNVHIIPNSTLDMITNMTKDYSRYLLDVGVAYRENVDEVIGILREIDEGMRQEPDYRWDILEPLEVMGLDRFEDSAVIIRTRLKTQPGKQWRIGREFKRRMKHLFDERGIEIPFPHRTLYWGTPKAPQPDPLQEALETHPLSEESN